MTKLRILQQNRQLELLRGQGHTKITSAVAVIPGKQKAISAPYDSTLKIWNLATGAELSSLQGHDDEINAVAV
ncbi:MAG: hypothetical protein F6K62_26000 [Sphaerospermopsis sp. SIO1G2]|nr:hypothetical protein [Sphaerospermopsis sp. SIO1G1]NET74250.1 hypothetical protein [Sphaerospermopsis sp. SIO1G2]